MRNVKKKKKKWLNVTVLVKNVTASVNLVIQFINL